MDGSKPLHQRYANDEVEEGPEVTCTPAAEGVESKMASTSPDAGDGPQIVLDDMDSGAVASKQNAEPGSYEPCMKDAYQGQFHHDWGKNKGSANFVFRFDPPKDGCYKIEEHHPGNDAQCARYMPRNANIDVDYCRGRSTKFSVNQAENGGQWNEIGWLPFYVGQEGRFTLRNHDQEMCDQQPCFWVADAFRVTWMGEKCHQTGVATVKVRPETDAQDPKDMHKTLLKHHNVFKATLELKLDSEHVNILGIVSAVGRRLLDTLDASNAFDVHFQAYGVSAHSGVVNADLESALQKAFSAAGAGVIVESASLRLDRPMADREYRRPQDTGAVIVKCMIFIGAIVALLAAAGMAALGYRCCTKKTDPNPTVAKHIDVAPVDEETAVDAKVVEADDGKSEEKKDDEEIRSVSTDEPGSDVHSSAGHSEEGMSNKSDVEQPNKPDIEQPNAVEQQNAAFDV
jgi:hypothetical protein